MKAESQPVSDFLLTRRGVINPNRTIGDEIFDVAERLGVFERPLTQEREPSPLDDLKFTEIEERVMKRLVLVEPGNLSSLGAVATDTRLSRDGVKNVIKRVEAKIGVKGKVRLAVAIQRSGLFS